MSKFKAGDVVVRINNDWGDCFVGGEYIVSCYREGDNELWLQGSGKGYDPNFFVLKKQDTTKEEAEIVKAWFDKLDWLTLNTTVGRWISLEVVTENSEPLYNEASVDFVINSYEAYQVKAKQKEKQELLDKKKALELELAQINEQLGE